MKEGISLCFEGDDRTVIDGRVSPEGAEELLRRRVQGEIILPPEVLKSLEYIAGLK